MCVPSLGTDGQWRPRSCFCIAFIRFIDGPLQSGQGSTEEAGNRARSGSMHLGLYCRETLLIEQLEEGCEQGRGQCHHRSLNSVFEVGELSDKTVSLKTYCSSHSISK